MPNSQPSYFVSASRAEADVDDHSDADPLYASIRFRPDPQKWSSTFRSATVAAIAAQFALYMASDGNLYDRLVLPGLEWHAPLERLGQPVYAVRDWIHVTVPGVIDWPIFNLADSWLVIGAGMLLWSSLRQPPIDAETPQTA
jgi:lipoprotein signal peptidase